MSGWHAVALRQKINQLDDFQLVTLPKIFRDVCKWARVATHFKASIQGGAVANVLVESWGRGQKASI
jgi:hypothetical protein